ncbi:MAG TPA: cell division protein FtsA [Candidatus Paceibacterota bacterium]
MGRTIVTGLDVGTTSVRVAVCEIIKGARHPKVLALVKAESRGLRRGYVINQEEASQAIRLALGEAARQSQTKIKNVFLGLGGVTLESRIGNSQIVVSRADAEITDNDINRAIELAEAELADMANNRVIHTIPIYFKLDGKKIPGRPEGMRGAKLEVRALFIVCLEQHLNSLVRAVEVAGVSVNDLVASPIAAALTALSTQQKTVGCVLANIGSQTTSLAVFEDGIPASLQILPIGSMDITNDIALGLRVPLDEAERLKINGDQLLTFRKKLDEIIEARLSDMFDLIEVHLKKIGRNGLLPAGVIITGGGGNIENIAALAKEELRLPARVFTPMGENQGRPALRDSNWIVAYGLCLFGLGGDYVEDSAVSQLLGRTKKTFLHWLKELWP